MNEQRCGNIPVKLFLLPFFALLLLATGCRTEDRYELFLSEQPQIPGGNVERGAELIEAYGCGTCHEIPGIRDAEAMVGPPLEQWARRHYIAGTLTNTPENLVVWIMNPQAIEPGTAMPDMGVTEPEARHIAAYLYSLND